ncbi:MAG: hypothetical protein IJN29_04090 [Akkermansia sp.]|nr:hypothetical protein [Akkermansia sp.]
MRVMWLRDAEPEATGGGGVPGAPDTPDVAADASEANAGAESKAAPGGPSYDASGYSFDEPAEEGATGEDAAATGEEQAEEAAAYEVEWPEDFAASDDLTALTNEVARECGVSDKALGRYTAAMIGRIEARHVEQLAAADAALKQEWGRDYAANVKEARAFMARQMKEHGLSAEDVADFATPRGFKVLYALSRGMGSKPTAGLQVSATAQAEAAWAEAVMADAGHPDNVALREVNDPRHREVVARYFRAQGGKV